MVRLASNSTYLGLVEPLLSPPQKIHRARILFKIMIEKRIAYELEGNGRKNVKVAKKPLPKDWEPKYLNGNVIDITPLLDDEWWSIFGEDPPEEESRLLLVPKSKAEGITSILNLHKKFVG